MVLNILPCHAVTKLEKCIKTILSVSQAFCLALRKFASLRFHETTKLYPCGLSASSFRLVVSYFKLVTKLDLYIQAFQLTLPGSQGYCLALSWSVLSCINKATELYPCQCETSERRTNREDEVVRQTLRKVSNCSQSA